MSSQKLTPPNISTVVSGVTSLVQMTIYISCKTNIYSFNNLTQLPFTHLQSTFTHLPIFTTNIYLSNNLRTELAYCENICKLVTNQLQILSSATTVLNSKSHDRKQTTNNWIEWEEIYHNAFTQPPLFNRSSSTLYLATSPHHCCYHKKIQLSSWPLIAYIGHFTGTQSGQ